MELKSCLLFLIVFLISSFILIEPRPISDEDLGIVIGPFTYPDTSGSSSQTPSKPDPEPEPDVECPYSNSFSRESFPKDFIFGTATSSYQIEGAKQGLGRGMSTWDEFVHKFSDKVRGNSDADIAVDFYNRYKEDIKLMKDLNTNGFRFSISWTRILPHGRVKKGIDGKDRGINEKGIDFYNNVIDELIKNGIQPAATLFHWESPLALEEEYGGFINERIVDDFRAFSKLCFERFGDRVKNWATFNEPWVYAVAGHSIGKKAPGRCSKWANNSCEEGDSGTEPYVAAHTQILAHVAAVEEFRNCTECKGGKIGIVLNCPWFEPLNPESAEDREAVSKSFDFNLGWFLHPLKFGDYPEKMKKTVGKRLPKFTESQSQKLREFPDDYVGLNYYGAFFVTARNNVNSSQLSYANDHAVLWTSESAVLPNLQATSMGIIKYARGLRSILKYIKDKYGNPEIFIMENGMDEEDDGSKPLWEATRDTDRKEFIQDHIWNLEKSICQDKVRVKGYFIWSLMDNFEWNLGYSKRFGLYHVDYSNGLSRYLRSSGKWLKNFLRDPSQPPSRDDDDDLIYAIRREHPSILAMPDNVVPWGHQVQQSGMHIEPRSLNYTLHGNADGSSDMYGLVPTVESDVVQTPQPVYTRYVSDMM